jgi:hypothetical protein
MQFVNVDPLIDADARLKPLVANATEVLERTVGPASAPRVSATWKLLNVDKDRQLIQLQLSDYTGATPAVHFAPDELESDRRTRDRMLRLWGDLLQVRSHKLLDEILKSSHETGTN